MADPRQSGFTLVELLVTLVLFGFLMALSFDALRFGGAVWDNVSTTTVALDEQTTTERFIRGRLEAMSRPVHVAEDARENTQWWLEGDRSEVSFVAPWYRGAAPAGLYRFRIWQERRNGTGALMVSWRPELPGADGADLAEYSGERILLTGVAALDLRYFGASEPGRGAGWSQRWRTPGRAPALVELDITSERTGQRWFRMKVATGH